MHDLALRFLGEIQTVKLLRRSCIIIFTTDSGGGGGGVEGRGRVNL